MSDNDGAFGVDADLARGKVTLTFADRAAIRSFFAAAKRDGGFMIPLVARPQPFATLTFATTDGASFEFGFQARAVQITNRGGDLLVAFLLIEWGEAKERELEGALTAPVTEDGAADPTADVTDEAEGDVDEGEHAGVSPIFRIKGLDQGKKMILAMKADRAERQILCRDSSAQVLLGLLSNPRIEAEEVLAIVKSTHASAAILQRVANERRWMGSAEIRTAVVRNPKTPAPLAIRLLDTLPISELRDMAKMGALREDVRRAALRVYTTMMSKR